MTLVEISNLLANTFPDGPPRVEPGPAGQYTICNDSYLVRLPADVVASLVDRNPADVAQVLVAQNYAVDLRRAKCLEIQEDLTWLKCS